MPSQHFAKTVLRTSAHRGLSETTVTTLWPMIGYVLAVAIITYLIYWIIRLIVLLIIWVIKKFSRKS